MSPRSTAALAIVVFATLASPASIGTASSRAAVGFQPTRSKATAYRVNARHNGIQTDHLTDYEVAELARRIAEIPQVR